MKIIDVPASFRDPSGFIFLKDNVIYRQVNSEYRENYDYLLSSGLYKNLIDSNLMIMHEEVDDKYAISNKAYKVIKPELIEFISYPYEWCFSQLKDAALATLRIQKTALNLGMTLKDCSAYNIQFKGNKPILIDTLSFEKYDEKQPWAPQYQQFCRHFIAPLSLMAYKNVNLNKLSRIYLDGIPIDLASSMLSSNTYFKYVPLYHIHINSKVQKQFADKPKQWKKYSKTDKQSLMKFINKLEIKVKKMKLKSEQTTWSDYYKDTNYSEAAFEHKKDLVKQFLNKINPKSALDLGANIGIFSRISSSMGIKTLSVDNDPLAVEKNYLECVKNNNTNILPLLIDLVNPSPGIGWNNKERTPFLERVNVDVTLALALIHHLAIPNNLPFNKIAKFFNIMCKYLIIEFVPKNDSQVQRLLSMREDIFPDYTQKYFEDSFKDYFTILDSQQIKNSERTLYLMERKI